MKYPPLYPDYRVIVPPRKKCWGVVWLAGNLLIVFCIFWLWPADKPTDTVEFWFWIAIFPTLFIGLLFAVRVLIYQIASGNQQAYRQIMLQEEERWWQQRSSGLPIELLCLLGPAGDKPDHHLVALERDIPSPKSILIQNGYRILRCPQILENDITRRELAITRHLARTLLDTYPSNSALSPVFHTLYWCGTAETAELFMQILSAEGWQFQQPFLPLNDIEQLDTTIDYYHRSTEDKNKHLLCAGVYCAKNAEPALVMGEAGFVWRVEKNRKVIVHRAEQQDAAEETAQQLIERVEKVAHLSSSPEYCLSFNHSAAEYLQSGGWSTLEYNLEPFWGNLREISPFVAISMAALQSMQTEEPCGWITRDKKRKCMMGVIGIDKE